MYACLRTIFERAPEFGGGLFALAASVMTDLTHHDPLCFPGLDAAGLPEAFIKAIKVCVTHHGYCKTDNLACRLMVSLSMRASFDSSEM